MLCETHHGLKRSLSISTDSLSALLQSSDELTQDDDLTLEVTELSITKEMQVSITTTVANDISITSSSESQKSPKKKKKKFRTPSFLRMSKKKEKEKDKGKTKEKEREKEKEDKEIEEEKECKDWKTMWTCGELTKGVSVGSCDKCKVWMCTFALKQWVVCLNTMFNTFCYSYSNN